jgi:tRNA(fMet)-specific endonuclease VapC
VTRYLLDTNHVSAIFQRRSPVIAKLQAAVTEGHEFAVCLPSIGELWFMVFNSARVAKNSGDLELILRDFTQVEYDLAAAVEFGRIKSELRRSGRPIPDVDVQIAAIAKVGTWVLLTADSHFANVTGVTYENWLVP